MNPSDRVLTVAGQAMIQLEDVPAKLADRLRTSLGAEEGAGAGQPDILVRWGSTPAPLHGALMIGWHDAAWAERRLILFARGGQVALRPLDGSPEIEVRLAGAARDISIVTGLAQLCLLYRGVLPIHAALTRHRGQLIGLAGWPRGGKTTALAALHARGAVLLGAEWLYLAEDGSVGTGCHPLRLRAAHLSGVPTTRGFVSDRTRVWLQALAGTATGLEGAANHFGAVGTPVRRLARKLEARAYVDVPLLTAPRVEMLPRHTLSTLILVVATRGAGGSSEVGAGAFAERLAGAFEEDLDAVAAAERRFRFAFGCEFAFLREWRARYREVLAERLTGVRCWEVRRRDPVDAQALGDAIDAVIG